MIVIHKQIEFPKCANVFGRAHDAPHSLVGWEGTLPRSYPVDASSTQHPATLTSRRAIRMNIEIRQAYKYSKDKYCCFRISGECFVAWNVLEITVKITGSSPRVRFFKYFADRTAATQYDRLSASSVVRRSSVFFCNAVHCQGRCTGLKVVQCVPSRQVPICPFRRFCCRMYRLATKRTEKRAEENANVSFFWSHGPCSVPLW